MDTKFYPVSRRHLFRLKAIVLLGLALATNGLAQTGYVYLHQRAVNEENSPNFTYAISGGPTSVPTISLSDQPTDFLTPVSLGGDAGGGFWAAAGAPFPEGNYPMFYRAPNSSTWIQSVGGSSNIDGGPAGTRIGAASGRVYYYDGTTETNITYDLPAPAVQVSDSWIGVQYVRLSNNQLYRKPTETTTWTAIGISALAIDAIPNSNRIAYIQTNNAVATANNDGTGIIFLGDPDGLTATVPAEVAVSGDGTIFARDGQYLYRYGGTGWVQEKESFNLVTLTGGPGSQLWGVQPVTYNRIYSRTATANYIADETVRTSPNDNSALVALAPGTYTITENAVANWNLTAIDVYQNAPAGSPSTSIVNRTATIAVRAGEVVHIVYENQLVQSTAITSTCSTSATFSETFGTGTGYGPELTGLTSFHHASSIYGCSYYAVISNTNLMGGVNGYAGNYEDHTPGDVDGRMLAVDATVERGTFYRRRFTGLVPGSRYTFSAWALNVNGSPLAIDVPTINVEVYDPATGALVSFGSSGNLIPAGVWKQTAFVFTATQTQLDLVLRNNTTGNQGNDLAIDDITFGVAIPDPVAIKSDANCTAGGSITVTSPLSSEYEYSINGSAYQTSPVFTNVTPGSYSVTARYVGGSCISQATAVTLMASICGQVFDDGNGLSDNTVNTSGTGAGSPLDGTSVGGSPLYATLLNSAGVTIAIVPVTSAGTYSFSGVVSGTYSVALGTNPAGSTTPSLPASYTNTGENVGTGAGSDGTPNGILSGINVGAGSVSNANFGIDKAPTAVASVASPQPNPGGTATVPVSSTLFSGSDQEDGAYAANLTGRSVQLTPATNGTLYYNGTPVSTTQLIPNFDPTQVSLDPAASGATTGTGGASPDPTFTYSVADNAGVNAQPATIRVPFTAALPVSLVSFSAQAQADHTVLVSWQTAWEKDNRQFVIERSKDLLSFEAVSQIRDVAGTSPTGSAYRFVDPAPYRGTSYYRLVQIDQDGTRQLYRAISVIVDGHYGVWPNPVMGERFTLALDEPATAQIELYSLSGQSIGVRRVEASATMLTLMAESKLAAGVYLVSVTERGTSRRYRLVVL